MQRETPDEFFGVERHFLDFRTVFIVFPCEDDFSVGEIQDPAVGNRDAMGVTPEVVDDLLRTAERGFGVHHPLVFAQRLAQGGEVRTGRCRQVAFCVRAFEGCEVSTSI